LSERALADFVDLAFARRLEMAETITPEMVELLRKYNPAQPIAHEQVAGGCAYFGGPAFPSNQMVGFGLYGAVTAQDLDRVEAFFHSRGVPSTIVVSPLADPSLRDLLGERGYRIKEFNSVLIRRIRSDEPFAAPPGIEIERVTPETASAWIRAIMEGFGGFSEESEDLFRGWDRLPGALMYLARIDGKIIGGGNGLVIEQARIAALFGASTLPPYRGRGVQSALIAVRLHEAAKHGCEYAVVSTEPGSGSQRNMERRGFRVAYTKVVMTRPVVESK
jgi:GNAT superfamily N-acetyltransferase